MVESVWGVQDRRFAGKQLITRIFDDSALGWLAETVPYTGRLNQAWSDTSGVPAVLSTQIKVYPSDKVYKFDSTGSVVHAVSGFNRPTYIVVDENQDCWVSHDTNTVTKIDTTNGTKTEDARVETSEFLTLCSANFNTDEYDVQQGGGISCDTSSQLMVINSPENRVFNLPINTVSLSASTVIDSVSGGTGSNM